MLEIQQHNREPTQQGQPSDRPEGNQQGGERRPWGPVVVRHARALQIGDLPTPAGWRLPTRLLLSAQHYSVSPAQLVQRLHTGELL